MGGGVGALELFVGRERGFDAAQVREAVRVERGRDRLEPGHPLGMPGRVDMREAVGMRDQRGRHGGRLGRRRRGFKGYSRAASRGVAPGAARR